MPVRHASILPLLAVATLATTVGLPLRIATAQTAGASAPHAHHASAAANQQLDSLAEAYVEELMPLAPNIAGILGDRRYDDRFSYGFEPDIRAAQVALDAAYRERLSAVDRTALDAQHQLTYDVFSWRLESSQRNARFAGHLLPLDQFFNFASGFAELGAGNSLHPFRTPEDYDDFLGRVTGFERTVDAAIANMREGAARGIVQPRVLMERVLPQLAAHLVTDSSASVFWRPIATMPAGIAEAERARLTVAYSAAIRERIVPAYRRLHDFVRDVYLPQTRTTVGLGALPDGAAWYAERVRAMTTTDLSPAEIHQLGLDEVARIHGEMEAVMRQVGWTGDLASFLRHMQSTPAFYYTTREEMLADYRATQARIDAATDRLFDRRPASTYEIRPVPTDRERSASGGQYLAGAPDGTRPGVFSLNTYDPTSRARYEKESLLVHEGSPGHHFQIMLALERTELPRLRRLAPSPAYSEGWGLYAETLGPELGFYTDPYQRFGALSGELWRAIRLVLDTGINAQGWTLDEAADYARRNSSERETAIRSEVERFAATPGQALAYKVGQLRISAARSRAAAALGPRFDVKAFHRAVLEDGPLPLAVLDAKVDRWIAEQQGDGHERR